MCWAIPLSLLEALSPGCGPVEGQAGSFPERHTCRVHGLACAGNSLGARKVPSPQGLGTFFPLLTLGLRRTGLLLLTLS